MIMGAPQPMWIDTHCHLDAPEFERTLPEVIQTAVDKNVQAILLPAVKVGDCQHVRELAKQYSQLIPGLVYNIHDNINLMLKTKAQYCLNIK
jgi:TatD DNase family protein